MPTKATPVPAKRTLREVIIPAMAGVKRVMHVFVPAMKHRLATPGSLLPSVCVRSSLTGFMGMKVYDAVEVLGPSKLEMVDQPLHGTGGRAQVLLVTEHALKVYTYLEGEAPIIPTPEGAKPEDILNEVIARYEAARSHHPGNGWRQACHARLLRSL